MKDKLQVRSGFLTAIPLIAMALALPLHAFADQPFSAAAFHRAQAEGKPILVAVHAKWCASCVRQIGVLAKLQEEPAFRPLVRFDVNYDNPGDALKLLDVKTQATLIVYNGRQEKGRSSFDTDAASIRSLVAKALPSR